MRRTSIFVLAIAAFSLFGLGDCQGSWQSYVNGNLLARGFTEAAIISNVDGTIWAKSPNFNLIAAEGQSLCDRFSTYSSFADLYLNGRKYLIIKSDERSLYGKQGDGGAICVKTGQSIVIGIYDKKLQPGKAATIVEKLADYLIDNGY